MRSATIFAILLGALAEAAPAGEAGQVILDEGSQWRMFASWNTPVTRKGTELVPAAGAGAMFAARTAPPPAEWRAPDFPDGDWSRWSLGRQRRREYDYGFAPAWGAPGPTLSLFCLRGKFAVEDPARVQKLTLSIEYRGGAVVYVNGQEVARDHLPKDGKIEPEAAAEDYPPEAFVHDDAPLHGSKCLHAEYGHPARYKDRLEKRIRRLENVAVDAKLLRKGVNVLAVEIHRAPYFGVGLDMEGLNHPTVWSTAGLVSLTLRADGGVAPNLSRPAGIQVWATNDMRRPSPMDYGNPLEKAAPVSIVGCRNGAFNGKVLVTSDQPLSDVKAQAAELKHRDGKGAIPAAAVRLFYTVRDDKMTLRYGVPKEGFWDSLADEPPAKVEAVPGTGAMQAIIMKVRVPADAAPGDYSGKLTVSAAGLPATDVPVNLRVVGWKLPDPRDFSTHMGLIQSPDSVAIQYKVPLWSEEHWKYLEESFKLLGELGNNYAVVPVISRTNFGNEQSFVRWVKNGGGYKYDFTVFDRYLDLAQKYQKVDVVCLYVWDWYCGFQYWGKGEVITHGGKPTGPKVTLWDPQAGKGEDLEGPKLFEPAVKAFLEPAFKEIAARLAKRNLSDAMMMGISGDARAPNKEMMENLKAVLPGARWIANPHGDTRGTSMYGLVPVGYNTTYYTNLCPPPGMADARHGAINGRYYGWNYQWKPDYYGRSRGPTAPLALWRGSVEAALIHNYSGLGRNGADFWPVLGREVTKRGTHHSTTVAGRYPESDWDQLNLDRGTEAFFCPGPKGAMPTERSEQVRQGIQECEARIFIEKALLAKKLDAETAEKCQAVLDERTWHIRGLGACGGAGGAALGGVTLNTWYEGAGSAGMAEKLFATAAEVAAKTGSK